MGRPDVQQLPRRQSRALDCYYRYDAFKWISGERPGYTNWAPGQPSGGTYNNSYAYIAAPDSSNLPPGKWGIHSYSDLLPSVVETPSPSASLQTKVGTFSGTNPANGQTLSFTLIDDHGGAFALDGNDLVAIQPLDHEAAATVNVTVRGSDQDGNTFDQTFAIRVLDTEEAPTGIDLSNASIDENSPIGTLVGNLTAPDPDGDSVTFSLVAAAADNAQFFVEGAALKTAAVFDFETKTEYSIVVDARDSTGLSVRRTFVINVHDVYELPTISLSSNFLADDAKYSADQEGAVFNPATLHDYARIFGDDDAMQQEAVDRGANLVTINDAAEQAWVLQHFRPNLVFDLMLGGEVRNGVFTWYDAEPVTYTNFDGNGGGAPGSLSGLLFMQGSGRWTYYYYPTEDGYPSVIEFPSTGTIGFLSSDGQALTYELVDDAGGKFTILGGNRLVALQSFRHETTPSIDVVVRGTDSDGTTYDQTFTFVLKDINEKPTNIQLSPSAVLENQPAGTIVGTLSATDPDEGESFTYSLVFGPGSVDNASFSISGDQLLTTAPLDADVATTYSIRVRATDSAGVFYEKVLQINPIAANDAPAISAPSGVTLPAVQEDTTNPLGVLVSSFAANGISDEDAGAVKGIAVVDAGNVNGTWYYSLNNGTSWQLLSGATASASRLLALDAQTRIRFIPKPNNESQGSFSYLAWDRTEGTSGGTMNVAGNQGTNETLSTESQTASIDILPLNDAPVLATGSQPVLNSIPEDARNPPGTLVSNFANPKIIDADAEALKGIAVTGLTEKLRGTWQFSLNGGTTWQALGSPSDSAARVLAQNARVRFVPKANYFGTPQLKFRAWDRSDGAAAGIIVDTGSKRGGTGAYSTASLSAKLTVTAVNDKPALTLSGSLGYRRNAPPIALAPNALVSDIDSRNFGGGTLRVRIASGGGTNNILASSNGFWVDGVGNVRQGSLVLGKRLSNGIGTHELKIQFNSNATKSIVQSLVRSITYRNVGGSAGQRKIEFTVSDGDGGLSEVRTKTVNVT